jgi:hypothetical protein
MKRALTAKNILDTKRTYINWRSDTMPQAFGKPECGGVWIVWGNSGSGKSSFIMQLLMALNGNGKILFNSLEEFNSESLKKKIVEHRILDLGNNITFVQEDISELCARLDKKGSAGIVVIDSVQYTSMNYLQYKKFKAKYPTKIIIFVSHADGKYPAGRTAKSIMYDAYMKIYIEGYKAFGKGREIGENGGTYTIWKEGAERYWGEI